MAEMRATRDAAAMKTATRWENSEGKENKMKLAKSRAVLKLWKRTKKLDHEKKL